jgi:hypothetical protein
MLYKLEIVVSRQDHPYCEVHAVMVWDRDEKGLPPGDVLAQSVTRAIESLDAQISLSHKAQTEDKAGDVVDQKEVQNMLAELEKSLLERQARRDAKQGNKPN